MASLKGENRPWSILWTAHYRVWRMHCSSFGMFFSIHLFTVFPTSVISCTIPAIFCMKDCSLLAFLVSHELKQMVKVGFIYSFIDDLPFTNL